MVGHQLHVLDVTEFQEKLDAFFQSLGPILDESGMELGGPPEVGEAVQVIMPSLRTIRTTTAVWRY